MAQRNVVRAVALLSALQQGTKSVTVSYGYSHGDENAAQLSIFLSQLIVVNLEVLDHCPLQHIVLLEASQKASKPCHVWVAPGHSVPGCCASPQWLLAFPKGQWHVVSTRSQVQASRCMPSCLAPKGRTNDSISNQLNQRKTFWRDEFGVETKLFLKERGGLQYRSKHKNYTTIGTGIVGALQ